MINPKTACEMIRKLSEVTEKDHFGSDAFYANKRIFATVWHNENKVNVRLTPELQHKFLETDGEAFCEIDNSWGRQGWTTIQLKYVDKKLFSEAVKAAWNSSLVKLSVKKEKTKASTKRKEKKT